MYWNIQFYTKAKGWHWRKVTGISTGNVYSAAEFEKRHDPEITGYATNHAWTA